jgi:TonB family protein
LEHGAACQCRHHHQGPDYHKYHDPFHAHRVGVFPGDGNPLCIGTGSGGLRSHAVARGSGAHWIRLWKTFRGPNLKIEVPTPLRGYEYVDRRPHLTPAGVRPCPGGPMSKSQLVCLALLTLGTSFGCSSGGPAPGVLPAPDLGVPASPERGEAPDSARGEAPPYPPPPGLTSIQSLEALGRAPTFTPYTRRPEVQNRQRVADALQQEYPPLLRKAGIGGTAQVWLFVDPEGTVRKVQINESSGRLELDQAALRVASVMEFSPAYNKDQPVPVWISIPITFTVMR